EIKYTGSLSKRGLRIALGSGKHYLDVNKINGNLFIKKKIDRESICEFKTECILNLEALLENPLQMFSVEVEILDVNDNAPRFPYSVSRINISESKLKDERFLLVKALDPDYGNNSVCNYKLSENLYFEINVQTWKDGSVSADLLIKEALDREKQAVHNLILTALDCGIPALSVSENTIIGATFVTLNATDADEGLNAELLYSFNPHTSEKAQMKFRLNSRTGELSVNELLDFEQFPLYELFVQAKDFGPNPLTGHCKVIIKVVDSNDNRPEIIVASSQGSVSEDVPIGTVLALFSVTDLDSGNNGRVNCHISDNVEFELQQTMDNVYALVTAKLLDRERKPSFNITIIVKDEGTPPLTNNKTIFLNVLDVNDNAPFFSRALYEIPIAENNIPGSLLCSITAKDPDADLNGALKYSIKETNDSNSFTNYFSINRDNGNIYSLQSFDYEQQTFYTFNVVAKDSGALQLSSSVTINITVLDENDNTPVIVSPWRPHGSIVILEDVPIGTVIALFSVTDMDSGKNGRVNCRISNNDEFKLQQTMDNVYALVTATLLDRERRSSFNVTIVVKDEGSPPLTNNRTIPLNLLDVNDNAPSFSRASFEIPIPENNIPGSLLYSITANDPDAALNGALKYSIVEKNDVNKTFTKYFSINSENGNIYSMQSFDYEQQTFYTFEVVAKDSGTPQLSSSVTVKITVLDENDNSPVIVSPWRPHGSIVSDTISSSAEEGYLVTKVIAIDEDSVQNSRITYHLLQVTDQTLFTLNQYSGELRTRRRFSLRDSSKQRLVIQARDNGNPSLSSTVTILISKFDPEVEGLLTINDEVETEYVSSLNMYLMIGLASASLLLFLTIVICAALKCHHNPAEDEKSAHRISCYSQRDSMISDLPAHSTLYSSDAYWHSVLLAESRKGKMLVRQSMPNGTGFIVSSLERNPEQGTISELADTPIQVRL
uniref:Cadherin domain-containing protein n=1 Tax=Erpetoichthys calabaricus TaxID=27687 RepID=A0A8C4SHZ8_ERPCA